MAESFKDWLKSELDYMQYSIRDAWEKISYGQSSIHPTYMKNAPEQAEADEASSRDLYGEDYQPDTDKEPPWAEIPEREVSQENDKQKGREM